MGKIDDYIIQRVLEATDIVEVVGEFVELKKKGARYIGLCPFHDDRHATNFSVYPRKQCYKCFACDSKGDAVKFLMDYNHIEFADAIRWLGRKYNINVDDKTVNIDYTPRPTPPPLPTLFIPEWIVAAREGHQTPCNLFYYLSELPWSDEQRGRIEEVAEMYRLGVTKYGEAIFWQIDENTGIRDGKIMKYRKDGHRDKENPYSISWVSSKLFRKEMYEEDDWEVRRCLFGLHLMNQYPHAEVHIVESEKTAVFCSIFFGEPEKHLWMATAGKGNLSKEILQPLIAARRTIALHPDRDGMEDWEQRRKDIDYNRAYVNNAIMDLRWKPEDGEKADIADILEREMRERRQGKTMKVGDIMKMVPAIKTLIDKFDCKYE